MHHYHKLQRIIDSHPVGAPLCDEYLEILKILFPPDDVELAVHLNFKLKKAGELAKELGMAPEAVVERMESMANRGVILAKLVDGEHAYALLPNYPGLFEYPVMKGVDVETQKRLAELWNAYYMIAMAAELASAVPPWNRILPAEEALNTEIEVLPYEVASAMMKNAQAIALGNCPCRTLKQGCDKPKAVCLSFDGVARFLVEREIAKVISFEEAMNVLKKAEEAALVHTASNNKGQLVFLCNCCSCCCHLLRLVTEHGYRGALSPSAFEARVDFEACIGCGICAEDRCPFGALKMNGDKVKYLQENCMGCGLCVSACPTGAISLIRRAQTGDIPTNMEELISSVMKNKGRRQV
ncbi:MAG: 4Fe-4S binding protein [Clostridia bacterium]|nr:4Fe-4S binding protein [Clostridia bacterium]